MRRDTEPWSRWDWDFSAVRRGRRMRVAPGQWCVVMETPRYCLTQRNGSQWNPLSAENIWGFPRQGKCLRSFLKGSHSSLEEVMGRKQKGINDRNRPEKKSWSSFRWLIALQWKGAGRTACPCCLHSYVTCEEPEIETSLSKGDETLGLLSLNC